MAGGDLLYLRFRDRSHRTVCPEYDPLAAFQGVSSERSLCAARNVISTLIDGILGLAVAVVIRRPMVN